ncbi:MAG: hypothetical protein IJG06_08515, partial [Clostridia bacterium]|nr:hypothetical protein [Clostridia bacterium]
MKSKTRTLTTKALSLLLSLALMLGLMPVMSLTASAEEYSFGYAYDCQRQQAFPKKGETCSTSGFKYPLISWKNSGTTNEGDWKLTYLGSYKDKSNVSTELPGIASSVQNAYSLSSTNEIPIYELKNGTNHIAYGVLCALANNNEEALFIGDTWAGGGGYVLSKKALSGTVSFAITKDITDIENEHMSSHTHNFTYSANGATITAVCTNAGCSLTGGKISFTLAAPGANLVYDGTAKKATLEGAEAFSAATGISVSSNNIVYNYTPFGGTNQGVVTETKNAGQYQALYTLQTTTLPKPFVGIDFTINKADSVPANVTANNSTYNGSAQALVKAGTATGGTMQYKLGADGTYSENIPKATDANKYTVYYKVKGDNNHNDSAENSVSVTIAPKEIGITWPADTERFFEHDGKPHSLTATATGLVNSDTCNVTVTGEQTDIGTYTATATGVSNSNYKLPTNGLTASFTIYPSLSDLWNAIGDEVWTGYGEQTGVISYSRGDELNEFRASFMGGKYTFDVPFGNMRFNPNSAVNNFDQDIYAFDIDLPAVTGMSSETLGVKFQDGKISGISSQNAGIAKMGKENDVSAWNDLAEALKAGGFVKLTQDITAESGDRVLTVPFDKTVVLDLNGHKIDRALSEAIENGSVIVNNGTLAIVDGKDGGKITGGNTIGNGGGIRNNGALTLYGGEITGNNASGTGGGVYNSAANTSLFGFWMTGGLIDGNTATTNPAISGDVTFNNMAVVQINADGATVSTAKAKEGMEGYDYIKPVMPDNEKLKVLSELYKALGDEVWTGYGEQTGVIRYSRGDEPNEFRASFMGGTYTFDVPLIDITSAEKTDNGDGSFTYSLEVPLPSQTCLDSETLKVTVSNGKITALVSETAGLDMSKEESDITSWSALQSAMLNGGVIKLTQDITAGNNDTALTVPDGKTV